MERHPAGDAGLGRNLISGDLLQEELNGTASAYKLFVPVRILNGQLIYQRPFLPITEGTVYRSE
jgi:hypothetical protein